MDVSPLTRRLSHAYLALIPFMGLVLALTLGHSPYPIYVPLWLLHVGVMLRAAWLMGAHRLWGPDPAARHLALPAVLFIGPWVLISVFAGMGPLPATAAMWVATAPEQQLRYALLIVSGVLLAAGFTLLRARLAAAGDAVYSQLGNLAVRLAPATVRAQ
ncbi:MAG: hypothetical protein NVS3B25_32680 [Hymenobacter sp.]